jgi:hypothetical protein
MHSYSPDSVHDPFDDQLTAPGSGITLSDGAQVTLSDRAMIAGRPE